MKVMSSTTCCEGEKKRWWTGLTWWRRRDSDGLDAKKTRRSLLEADFHCKAMTNPRKFHDMKATSTGCIEGGHGAEGTRKDKICSRGSGNIGRDVVKRGAGRLFDVAGELDKCISANTCLTFAAETDPYFIAL